MGLLYHVLPGSDMFGESGRAWHCACPEPLVAGLCGGGRDQHPAAHSQIFQRQTELSRGHVLVILPALPGAGRCSSGASCPASGLKFASGRWLGLVSIEKGDGWLAGGGACIVPTLHSNGSQAMVGTAGPGHSAEEAACGSTALCPRPTALAAGQQCGWWWEQAALEHSGAF